MKRMICILLSALILSGCSVLGERIKEPVTFYYISDNYQNDMQQVIVPEIREASGHREDITYLLALYSMGPSNEDLMFPLPKNVSIIPIERTDKAITLNVSASSSELSEADFTLTSACIALTCMELTDVDRVTVVCGDRDITIQDENLLLYSNTQQLQEDIK